MVYTVFSLRKTMKIFRKYGELLNKHDIGAVFDNSVGEYVGTALLCRSPTHTSISVNIQDFKFASKCFQYMYCQNCKDLIAVVPMEQAIELFKRGRQFDEFVVIEWFEIEQPSNVYELPFDK
jgi:hypothetical protein